MTLMADPGDNTMKRYLLVLFALAGVASCGNDATSEAVPPASAQAQGSACDLLTKEQVEAATGLAIINVSARDSGVFTTCSFETDDWTQTIGLIYFPGLGVPADAASLAAQVEADLQRDQVDYVGLAADDSIGDAAVRYATPDGSMYWVVAHRGGHRVIVNAGSVDAVTALARQALASIE
jgi:hypothetical protein